MRSQLKKFSLFLFVALLAVPIFASGKAESAEEKGPVKLIYMTEWEQMTEFNNYFAEKGEEFRAHCIGSRGRNRRRGQRRSSSQGRGGIEMRAIYKRELKSYFDSMIGYLFIAFLVFF